MQVPSCLGCRERDARIAALEAEVAALRRQVEELQQRLERLTPPPAQRASTVFPKAPAKQPTGKRPGGQPGHPPHLKQLLPPERVQRTVPFVPTTCARCQTPLPPQAGPDDPPPTRHQVAELPEVAAVITEYQGHHRTCPGCGHVTHAAIPVDLRAHSVGPKLTAVLAYLVGCHGVSKRGIEEISAAVFAAPIALGTVAHLEQEVSAALAPVHAEAVEAVRSAPVKHVDETGWKQAGRKRWLWVAATTQVVVFLIDRLRNLLALRKLLGPTLAGILCSDRWRAYDDWPVLQRQVCWAHLKRNFEKLQERGGKAQVIATAALDVQRQVFEWWHLFRGGGCSREVMDEQMAGLSLALLEVLGTGARSRDPKLVRFCRRLWSVYPALWTFVVVDGVEPTNNHAERVQRRAVLWRRRSFGCHSAAGCRFVERILTVVQSLRLQERSVVQFLHQAIEAHRHASAAPKLVLEG